MRASFSLCSAAQTHNAQIALVHVSLQLLTNPRGQDFHHLSAFPQKIPHSSGFISVYQLCTDMQREEEEEEEDRETGLTYDETESPGGGQQWPVAVGRNHPRGVYIRGIRYGYGAPVYGNAESSDQSVSKILKYHQPLPTSPHKSAFIEEEPGFILGLCWVPPGCYKREEEKDDDDSHLIWNYQSANISLGDHGTAGNRGTVKTFLACYWTQDAQIQKVGKKLWQNKLFRLVFTFESLIKGWFFSF